MTDADLFRFARATAARLRATGALPGAKVIVHLRELGLSAVQAADVVGFGVRRNLLRRDPIDPSRLCAVEGAERLQTPVACAPSVRRPVVLVVDDDPDCASL